MLRPANAPWFLALAQCSTRRARPAQPFCARAMSPAAQMCGSLVRSRPSTATPLSPSRTRPAASASSRFGSGADPDNDEVGTDDLAVVQQHATRPPVRLLDCVDLQAGSHVDAVRPLQLGPRAPDLAAHDAEQRRRLWLDNCYVKALLAGSGRDLQADPAAPPTTTTDGRTDGCHQRLGVLGRPQVVHAGQVGPRHVEHPRRRTGGQQQPVIGQLTSVGQRHDPTLPVESGGPMPEHQVDRVRRRTNPRRGRTGPPVTSCPR